MSLLQYHHWISFIVAVRFGAFTSAVASLLLFLGLTVLLVGTLIGYIVFAPVSGESVQFYVSMLAHTSYITVLTFILVGLLELIFRNIRTGCLTDIETFKLEMFEGEDKPKNLRTKYNYVEWKKYNIDGKNQPKNTSANKDLLKPYIEIESMASSVSIIDEYQLHKLVSEEGSLKM